MIASSHTDFSVRVSNKACKMIKTLEVPASMSEDGGFTTSLGDGVWLSWHVPDCKDCEVKGGVCGFQKNGNKQIGCFYNLPNSGNYLIFIWIIFFALKISNCFTDLLYGNEA